MAVFTINPVFLRHRLEAELVGHILSSFGEIEVQTCINAGNIHKLLNPVMSTLYGIKVTSTRIETALRLTLPAAELYDLTQEVELVTPMIWHCVKIRNQYAHCNWADHPSKEGVFFADLQDAANEPNFYMYWKFVDVSVLTQQLEFFDATYHQLNFMAGEITRKTGAPTFPYPRPTIPTQSPLHNPPHEHVPSWLDEDGKRLHSAKALAALGGPPTPTPGQLKLNSQREAKRARQAEQRQKSRDGEKNAKERSAPEVNN
jgi:hypothetical protein